MSDTDLAGVAHFPIKLWDVVNDESSDIFRWSADGESFFVDDLKYENEVMEKYPGFAQIPSFANLRRLLREYSFSWQNNDTGEFQFSHPGFKKERKDLLHIIRTKRKSIQAATGHSTNKIRRRSSDAKGLKSSGKVWLQPSTNSKVNFRDETLKRFPEKFWAVVDDPNDLLYWGEDGDTVIVDDKKYEEEIMLRYPGFTQINSFANLRRLLREYGFSWSIRENGFFEFSHSHMKRGHPELLKGVKTKRKAAKAGTPHPYLPYFKMESYHSFPTQKCFSDRFDHVERQCQSSPEINQAINTIHSGNTSHLAREIQHGGGGGDHGLSPHHSCAFPPHRMIPSYQAVNMPHHHMHHAWAYGAGGDKIDPHYYYPAWSETQFPCVAPSYGENADEPANTQISPVVDDSSRSGVQPSTASSHESVYASSSKGSNLPTAAADTLISTETETEHNGNPEVYAAVSVEPVDVLPSCRVAGGAPYTATMLDQRAQRFCPPGSFQPLNLSSYPSPVSDYMSVGPVVDQDQQQTGNNDYSDDESQDHMISDEISPPETKPVVPRFCDDVLESKSSIEESNNNNNSKPYVKESNPVLAQLLDKTEQVDRLKEVSQLQGQLLDDDEDETLLNRLDTANIKQENVSQCQYSKPITRANV